VSGQDVPPDFVPIPSQPQEGSGIEFPSYLQNQLRRDLTGGAENGERFYIDKMLGTVGAAGAGIIDSGLALGRGAYWLGMGGPFRDVDTSHLWQSVYDMLPAEQAAILDSRIASAGFAGDAAYATGQILSLIGGGAPGAAAKAGRAAGAAKGLTNTEKALQAVLGKSIGGKLGKLGEAVAKPAALPSYVMQALSTPGRMAGHKLAKLPGVRQWSRLARNTPDLLGAGTGFAFYNYATTDQDINLDGISNTDDRYASALHGLFAGTLLSFTGKVADKLEGALLRTNMGRGVAGVTGLSMKKRSELLMQLQTGTLPSLAELRLALGPKALGTIVEATGWAALDERFFDALSQQDFGRAAEIYAMSVPGALLARTGRVDTYKEWRRLLDQANNMANRRAVVSARRFAFDESTGESAGAAKAKKDATDIKDADFTVMDSRTAKEGEVIPMEGPPVDPNAPTFEQRLQSTYYPQQQLPESASPPALSPQTPQEQQAIAEKKNAFDLKVARLNEVTKLMREAAGKDTAKWKQSSKDQLEKRKAKLKEEFAKVSNEIDVAQKEYEAAQAEVQKAQLERGMQEQKPAQTEQERQEMFRQAEENEAAYQAEREAAGRQLMPVEQPAVEAERMSPEQALLLRAQKSETSQSVFRRAIKALLDRKFAAPPQQAGRVAEDRPQIPEDVMAQPGRPVAPEPPPEPEKPTRPYEGKAARSKEEMETLREQMGEQPADEGQAGEQPSTTRPEGVIGIRDINARDQVSLLGDPLVRAGFELPNDHNPGEVIVLEYPGTLGEIQIVTPDDYEVTEIRVPGSWYKAVRGVDVGTSWAVLRQRFDRYEFVRDLAALAQMRQMSQAIHVGPGELYAGGPASDGEGNWSRISITGNFVQGMLPLKPPKDDGTQLGVSPIAEVPDSQFDRRFTRGLAQDYLQWASSLRSVAPPTRSIDLIEAAITMAIHGNVEAPNVQHTRFFLAELPETMAAPDAMAPASGLAELAKVLKPAEVDVIAEVLGELGSGNLAGDRAFERMQEIFDAEEGSLSEFNMAAMTLQKSGVFGVQQSPKLQKELEFSLRRLEEIQAEEGQGPGGQLTTAQKKAAQRAREKVAGVRSQMLAEQRKAERLALRPSSFEQSKEAAKIMREQGRDIGADALKAIEAIEAGALDKARNEAITRETVRLAEDLVERGATLSGTEIKYEAKKTLDQLSFLMGPEERAKMIRSKSKLTKADVDKLIGDQVAEGLTLVNMLQTLGVAKGRAGLNVKTVQNIFDPVSKKEAIDIASKLQKAGVPMLPPSSKEDRLGDYQMLISQNQLTSPTMTHDQFDALSDSRKRQQLLQDILDGHTVTSVSPVDSPANNSTRFNLEQEAFATLHVELANQMEQLAQTEDGQQAIRDRFNELHEQLWSFPELSVEAKADIKRRLAGYYNRPEVGMRPKDILDPQTKAEVAEFWKQEQAAWNERNKHEQSKKEGEKGFADVNFLLGGAAGMVSGAAFGPIGMAVGGVVGAGVGGFVTRGLNHLAQMKPPARRTFLRLARAAALGARSVTRSAQSLVDLFSNRADAIRSVLPNHRIANDFMEIHSRRRLYRGEMDAIIQPVTGIMRKKAWREAMVDVPITTTALAPVGAPGAGAATTWDAVVPGVLAVQWARWRRVGEGDEPASSSDDKAWNQAFQSMLKYAYDRKQNAGGWIGEGGRVKPLGDLQPGEAHRAPRVLGPDYKKVLADGNLRAKWFAVVEAMNPGNTAAEAKRLEDNFQTVEKGKAASMGSTVNMDRKTAIERLRVIENMPDTFTVEIDGVPKTLTMYSVNPDQVVLNTQRLQSGEIASTEVNGQDASPETRKSLEDKVMATLNARNDLVQAQATLQAEKARQAWLPAKLAAAQAQLQKSDADLQALQAQQSNLMTASERAKFNKKLAAAQKLRTADQKRVNNMNSQIANAVGRVSKAQGRVDMYQNMLDPRAQLLANAVLQNLRRGGFEANVTDAVQTLFSDQVNEPYLTKMLTKKLIQEGALQAQGIGLPEQGLVQGALRFGRAIDSLPRAVMAFFAPAYDVAEYPALPLMFGTVGDAANTWRRLIGTYNGASVRDKLEHYLRLGVVSSQMSKLMYEHTDGVSGKLTTLLGKPGEFTENRKAVLMGIMADVQLDRFRSGHAISADKYHMELLGLPVDMQQRLMTGKFTDQDANRYRIDHVRFTTRRAEPGEGVPVADSRAVQFINRFTRFITAHMEMNARHWSAALKEGLPMKERVDKLGRAAGVSAGIFISTTTGFSVVGVILHGLLSGDSADGSGPACPRRRIGRSDA
jgi:hypothetical protein